MTARTATTCGLLVLLAGSGAGLWWWTRPAVPPAVPLEGLEPVVAQALTEARATVLAEPRSSETWGTLGRSLLANELHPEIAFICFREAERLDPDNPRWPYFSGLCLLNQQRKPEAAAALERAVAQSDEADPASVAPRLLRAETLIDLDQSQAADTLCQQVFRRDPSNPRVRWVLARLASGRGDWPSCRGHLEACLGSPQARKKACAQLAYVYARLDDKARADHYADLAARLPKDIDWTDPWLREHQSLAKRKRDRYRIAEQLEAEGRLGDAADVAARLVTDYPGEDLPHLILGRVLAQQGQLQRAEENLHRALQLAPDKIQVHYLLSLTLFLRGEALWQAKDGDRQQARGVFEESASAARRVLALNPDYGRAHMALGRSLQYLGRSADAIAELREAAHCNPEHSDIHLFLGIALAEDGKLSEARPYLEQARLLAGPNDPGPRKALAKFFPKDAPPK